MKKTLWTVVLVGMVLWYCPGFGEEKSPSPAELSIVTGQEQGTYYVMARDLRKLAGRNGIDLNVIPSLGSVENLLRVDQFPSIQLGMVQLDTLAIAVVSAATGKDEDSAELRNLLSHIRVVFPLYREEVHLVASADIRSLADLHNKRVSIGKASSGTYGTAQVILHEYKVGLGEVFTMDTEQAIEALRRGQIDAFFAVVGAPADVLAKGISKEDKFHVVPIIRKEGDSYESATLPANTYSWQPEAVPTVSILNVLITSDKNMKGADCQNIGRFAKTVYDNLGWLKGNGHPKWKDVTIGKKFLVGDKLVSPCVSKAMSQAD
ncbi:MAG: TAXI family TRAP transporter solute-binding subunit [Nitrospirae bacterium]|nr:TAXI family TRAP transporter solute-binding subunit [Nitrospirota bacterium]